jgi:hypothetical protein
VIGTFIVGSFPELLRPFASHLQGVYGILIIVMMVLMPGGIYGAFQKFKVRYMVTSPKWNAFVKLINYQFIKPKKGA